MKMFLATFLISLTASAIYSQKLILDPVVDERVELLSIVFRLAGTKGYMSNDVKTYTDAIDTYFKSYQDNAVIKFARKNRKIYRVSYDAVMSMAIHIELVNGTIWLKSNFNKNSLDSRWGNRGEKFVLLLNDFYKESDFHKFFSDHKPLYTIAEKRFSEISKTTDLNWFETFYGEKPAGNYNLIISLTNGRWNYGPKIRYINGSEDLYSIIGSWKTDSLGFPVYSDKVGETIIHEFCHSFCNQLVVKYYPEMKGVSDKFYKLAKNEMRNQAYGNSETMLYEILVRSSVIKYFQAHGANEEKIIQMIRTEQARGFIWIAKLVDALTKYEASRTEYPNLDKYMHEIVKLQNSLSPEELLKETEANRPQIVSFSIKNNSIDVDAAMGELIITFDRSMNSQLYGMSFGDCGVKCYPKLISVKWNPEKKNELIIAWALEPDHHYSMVFPAQYMMDENGFYMKETYSLDFKTKKQ
jgi:hypothetical protein